MMSVVVMVTVVSTGVVVVVVVVGGVGVPAPETGEVKGEVEGVKKELDGCPMLQQMIKGQSEY